MPNLTPDPETLSPASSLAIRQSAGRMPYSSGIYRLFSGPFSEPLTVDDVVAYLDALAEILRAHADEVDAMHAELVALRRQRDAVRAFLGTEATS